MTTQPPNTEPAPEAPEPPEDDKMAQLEEVIERVVKRLLPTNRGRAKEPEVDVEAQVARAVEHATIKEKLTAAERALKEAREVSDEKKARKEKAPREYKPIHKVMGWVTEEDENT